MTGGQCLEARRLLGLTQRRLAKALGLSQAQISLFETTGVMPRAQHGKRNRLAALLTYFEQAGVQLIEKNGDGGPGVRLREPIRASEKDTRYP